MSVEPVQFHKLNRHVCPHCEDLLIVAPGQRKIVLGTEKAYVIEETYRCGSCDHIERWIARDPGTSEPSLTMLQHQSHNLELKSSELQKSVGWIKRVLLVALFLLVLITYEEGIFEKYLYFLSST